ncbi:MAG: GatB/YqeY domain-containing protein [Candidatus Levybacteria bacterium]|nr:GatB/YqeY domain-containing protein [Candidatus Levybacteria bacterium]
MLKQKLQEELKQSMLSRNTLKTSVLRMLLSSINYSEIQKGGANYQATDDDVISAIQKEAKQRKDSIEQFSAAKRLDLAGKESEELEILKSYLPEQMSLKEVETIVKNTISEVEAKTLADMGRIMGAIIPKIKGKADAGLVSQIVKEELSK